ncbi:MAG: helix-turn-helix domain-containing protein, partial [Rubrobacter sp.]
MGAERNGTFGEMLRGLRESAGLTQEELAALAGMTAKGVSALERGERRRPYPHTVRSLADALSLLEEERAVLFAAIPKRAADPPIAPKPRAAATATPESRLPAPPTSLLGR